MKFTKAPRLKSFDYKGPYAYSITLCTSKKRPLLSDAGLVQSLLSILEEEAEKHGFALTAYCFMPDHLHILVQGKSEDSDL